MFYSKEDLSRLHGMIREHSDFFEVIDDISAKPILLYGASKSPQDLYYEFTSVYHDSPEDVLEKLCDDVEDIYFYEHLKETIKDCLQKKLIKNFTTTAYC